MNIKTNKSYFKKLFFLFVSLKLKDNHKVSARETINEKIINGECCKNEM